MLKSRRIRFETLEERNLLTAVPGTASAAELPQPTGANTWVVTTLSDTVDESDGFLSLREAVDRAMDGDMITFSSSLYGGTIRLNNGYIKISRAITITGSNLASSGVNGITISGAGRSRVFYTAVQNGIVTLDYINITNGNAGDGGEGSGIYNTGGLLLDHCALSACTATGHSYGGALRNRGGSVNVTNCSFSNNSSYLGAGISNKTGTVTVTGSSFTGNTTTANGGALYNEGILLITSTTITGNRAVSGGAIRNFGTMTVTNSRITGNVASDLGGGIWSSGTTTVRNCTVASNSASQGGGIYHDASESGSLLLYNTIVYANTQTTASSLAGTRDIFGTATGSNNLSSKTISGNDNIVYTSSSATLFNRASSGDYTLVDGSPAIDAGNNSYAVNASGSAIVYDLAGNSRIVNNIVDIGAYEAQSRPSVDISLTGYSGVYDAMPHTVTLVGALATDTVYYSTDGVSYTLAAPPAYTNIGTNTVFAKVERSGYTAWTGSAVVAITPRQLSISGTAVSDKTYDATTAATVSVGTVVGLIAGDSVNVMATGTFPSPSVGSYSVPVYYTITGANASNYSTPASTLCAASITARPITVTGTTVSDKAYDGTTAATVNIGTVSGLIAGDAVNVMATGTFPSAAVGSYSVPVYYTITGANASNYTAPASTLCAASITDTSTSKISVSVVVSNTAPAVSELATLPASISSAEGGSTVYAQVWVKNNDGSTLGITGGYVDVNYTYPQLIYSSYGTGTIFTESSNLVVSSGSGNLSLFGGCPNAEATSVGVSGWALLGYAAMTVSGSGTVTVSAAPPTLNGTPTQGLNLTRLTQGTIATGEIDYSSVTFTVSSSLPPLETPTITTVSSYGANRHRVAWSGVSNAVQYQLDWSTDQTNWNTITTTDTSEVVTGLTYGSLVYYRVRAIGNGTAYGNSAWSSSSSLRVCPMDIDGDGFIGSGDHAILSSHWLDTSVKASWDPRADVDGDGLVGPGDWSFLMSNWFKYSTATPLYYPPARANLPAGPVDTVFAAADDFFADEF